MAFAFFFLLFFTVDILIGHGHVFFGLLPEQMLFTSVGVFTTWGVARNLKLFESGAEKRTWLLFLVLVSFITMAEGVGIFKAYNIYVSEDRWYILDWIAIAKGGMAILILLNLKFTSGRPVFGRFWLTACSVYLLLYSIFWYWVDEVSPALFFFSGFFDLPIMFCWLVLSEKLIYKRIGYDQS